MRRIFLLNDSDLNTKDRYIELPEFWSKRLNSLRVSKSVFPVTVNCQANWYQGHLEVCKRRGKFIGTFNELSPFEPEEKTTLLLAVLKDFYSELAVRVATELMIDKIIFFRSRRTVGFLNKKKLEKLHKLAIEHSSINGRLVPLQIEYVENISQLPFERFKTRLLFLVSEDTCNSASERIMSPTIGVIGPEGDLTLQEIEFFREKGFNSFSFGNFVFTSWASVALFASLVWFGSPTKAV
ncbi:MAG: RsmE family RNA methyltransferase [Deltaproteobacteria bacterium]|nr:RsmE family RNA methyltransferase [Deltaproteobacteria bacterium]